MANDTNPPNPPPPDDPKKVKDQLGVKTVSLDDLFDKLKSKLKDPEVGIEKDIDGKIVPIDQAAKEKSLHRYTIVVPNKTENAIINIGEKNEARKLNNVGISLQTVTHIQLQNTGAESTMLALGGPVIKPELAKGMDPDTALTSNKGFVMVTVSNAWIDSDLQLNLVSQKREAHLRSKKSYVRIQADEGPVGVAAKDSITIGSKKNVYITAKPGVSYDGHTYGKPIIDGFEPHAKKDGLKNAMTYMDALSAIYSLTMSIDKSTSEYDKGKLKKVDFWLNEVAKSVVDFGKLMSTLARFTHAQVADGQVKISADTYASVSGGVAASMYGPFSASVTSPVSASLLGGTAGVKGLLWASIFAGAGVSLKTATGSASIGSDQGKVSISAKKAAKMTSKADASVSGDEMAELKSKMLVHVAAIQNTKVTAGEGAGMGMLATKDDVFIGTVSDAGTASSAARSEKTFVKIDANHGIFIQSETETASSIHVSKDHVKFQANQFIFNGKQLNMKARKTFIGK